MSFDDLLAANERYATSAPRNFDGYAHAGVAIVTCMDSRLEPLEMVGLFVGEAKILRTPGGHLTDDALAGCVLAVHFLRVTRIMIIAHTRCAVASASEDELERRILQATGIRPSIDFGADPSQLEHLVADVEILRHHELVGDWAEVGGFLYDVETGRISQVC